MRRAAIVLLGWGAWIGIADSIQAIFGPRQIQYEMLGVASAATLLLGLGLWALDVRRAAGEAESARLLADSSFATATLIAGLVLMLLGAGFGLWLILIGVGVTALGAGGLVREALARRTARNLARDAAVRDTTVRDAPLRDTTVRDTTVRDTPVRRAAGPPSMHGCGGSRR